MIDLSIYRLISRPLEGITIEDLEGASPVRATY